MSGLLYREDMDDIRKRITRWWHGGDIGRPFIMLKAPREKSLEEIEELPKPEGWLTNYSTSDFEYRVNLFQRQCVNTHFLGEAVPFVGPHLAPNCLALYLGCRGLEMPDTCWAEPFIEDPEEAIFEFDPENYYWKYTLRLANKQLELGRGKYLVEFPDLIEGLDTLAAMRGTKNLHIDMRRRPDWVHSSLRQITDRYFHYYDILYDMIRDEVGGSVFWAWAPGRMAKFQCDFSAMISPDMFGEFMVPVLREMCERVSYCMYHWDGPGALPHHDHLLSIPRLDILQWTPGWGVEQGCNERWWPIYHKTFEGGKSVYVDSSDLDGLRSMKEEFGENFKRFMFSCNAKSLRQAEEILDLVND